MILPCKVAGYIYFIIIIIIYHCDLCLFVLIFTYFLLIFISLSLTYKPKNCTYILQIHSDSETTVFCTSEKPNEDVCSTHGAWRVDLDPKVERQNSLFNYHGI